MPSDRVLTGLRNNGEPDLRTKKGKKIFAERMAARKNNVTIPVATAIVEVCTMQPTDVFLVYLFVCHASWLILFIYLPTCFLVDQEDKTANALQETSENNKGKAIKILGFMIMNFSFSTVCKILQEKGQVVPSDDEVAARSMLILTLSQEMLEIGSVNSCW